MSLEIVDEFKGNIKKYFEVPDPRSKGRVVDVIRGFDDKQFRDFGYFQVFNYEDTDGLRLGGLPSGRFRGIGLKLNRYESVTLLAKLEDKENLYRWNYHKFCHLSGVGFENELSDEASEAAVQLTVNPLLFTNTSILTSITAAQKLQLEKSKEEFSIKK